jgi:rubrerythrin
MKMFKKFLALFSMLCPVCNIVRRFPDSKFAKIMEKREKNCPACKAYNEIFKKED